MRIRNDAPQNWNINFQDTGSLIGEGIINLHNRVITYSIVIMIVVLYMMTVTIIRYRNNKIVEKYSNHSTSIEIIWTIIPTIIIMIILGPSFVLLYMIDEVIEPIITVKFIGHQWYWTVEYRKDNEVSVYMINEEDLELGQLNMLEVDNKILLPINTEIRTIISSGDVIHSLGIPSLGIKMDAIPGRLNQLPLIITRKGTYYGGCYELCGAMHSAMPIVIEGVSIDEYILYLISMNE